MSLDGIVLNRALEGIAAGATKQEVREDIERQANFGKKTVNELLSIALDDALSCGVEREDIDPSWFGHA